MYVPIHEELEDERQVEIVLSARGWTQQEIRAVLEILERTYRNEEEYEHADNLRLARADNPDEVAAYEQLRSCGCCGDLDERVTAVGANQSSTVVMVGFNYGH